MLPPLVGLSEIRLNLTKMNAEFKNFFQLSVKPVERKEMCKDGVVWWMEVLLSFDLEIYGDCGSLVLNSVMMVFGGESYDRWI